MSGASLGTCTLVHVAFTSTREARPTTVYIRHAHARLFATPWTIARRAPLSMGFSRQEYWSMLPCPPPGDLPDPGTEPVSFMSPAMASRFFTTSATWEAPHVCEMHCQIILILSAPPGRLWTLGFKMKFTQRVSGFSEKENSL